MSARQRILFFGEAATLAHAVRPIVLAGLLDADRYEIELATGVEFQALVTRAGLKARTLDCIGTRAYLDAVAAGRVVFPYDTLQRYVQDDLRHIEAFRPDLVVGDFRLSLGVSARLAGVPYLALSNAYWSPYARTRMQVPVHAATRLIGPGVAGALFRPVSPLVLAVHSLPMHRLRRRHGLPSLGLDLRRVFTEGDVTLFADVPQLVPTSDAAPPGRYRYIGPVVWSAGGDLPAELRDADSARLRDAPPAGQPLVYLALGSSGDAGLLTTIVQALATLPCRIVLATGAAAPPPGLPADAIVAGWLPGDRVAARARVVICNGGSPGTHQALGQGTPVLGIPANLDQLLNMQFVEQAGAGRTVRADAVSVRSVREAVGQLLTNPEHARCARRVASWFAEYDTRALFGRAVAQQIRSAGSSAQKKADP